MVEGEKLSAAEVARLEALWQANEEACNLIDEELEAQALKRCIGNECYAFAMLVTLVTLGCLACAGVFVLIPLFFMVFLLIARVVTSITK